MPGINEPSYYLSGALSFSEIHPEDGYYIIHWGETGAEQIWLFVHPAFFIAFIDAVYDTVEGMLAAK